MNRITALLREWGDWVIRHVDHADEYGDSILYRISQYGHLDPAPGGHKVLCPDMPRRLREIERLVRGLPNFERKCVTIKFCAPLKEDGNPYTNRDLARMLKTSKYNFEKSVRKAKKRLEILDTG